MLASIAARVVAQLLEETDAHTRIVTICIRQCGDMILEVSPEFPGYAKMESVSLDPSYDTLLRSRIVVTAFARRELFDILKVLRIAQIDDVSASQRRVSLSQESQRISEP